MNARFEGKVAWITGGGTGIGRALAIELARQGADVAVSGRRLDKAMETAAAVRALGRRALAESSDVTDEAQTLATAHRITHELGRLDVVVANAAFGASGAIAALPAEVWRRQFDTNVVGLVSTARAALPELHKTQGRLVLVGSVMGFMAVAGQGPYAASKFAVRAIGLTLAQELAGSGVTCTTIHPGFVDTAVSPDPTDPTATAVDTRPAILMWTPEKAARAMADAIWRREREMVFSAHGKLGAFVGRHFSGVVHFAMTRTGARRTAASVRQGPG